LKIRDGHATRRSSRSAELVTVQVDQSSAGKLENFRRLVNSFIVCIAWMRGSSPRSSPDGAQRNPGSWRG
jgi:hypothetical protein